MKSKKMLKFLVTSILIATVTTSNALVFAKKEKIKTVEVVENPKNVIKVKDEEIPKDVTENKINTKEEIENKIKEEDKNFSENRKIETKKEEELFNKNKETFKNFDENKYKIDGFELIPFNKNGAPILLYKHIKTGAIIIIIPIDTINSNYARTDLFALNDYYIFKAFKPDDRGLVHYLEHCISSNILEKAQEKDTRLLYFNAYTWKDRLFIVNNSIYADKSFIENLAQELKSPEMLKNKNVFKREQSRILNEAEKDLLDYEINENKCIKMPQDENYNPCGTPEELKKISPDEVKKYFKQIIHPSNLLAIRYSNLNPDDVIKYIKILEKYYLKYFNRKEISDENFRKKEYCNFKKIETCKTNNVINSKNAMGEEKDYDYMAKINFLDPENQKEKDLYYKFGVLKYFSPLCDLKEKLELEKFVKNLGYSNVSINSLNEIVLYGDDEKLFEKEKLIENYNKIFEFILKKFENFSDEEIEKNIDFLRAFGYNTGNEYLNLEQKLFSNPMLIEKNKLLAYFLMDNFINFNDPLSKNTLEITENNEIKDSKEHYIKKIKKDILNLKEFKNKTPSKIRVFFRSKNNKLGSEYLKASENLKKIYIIPLKFKETKNKALVYLVKDFLIKELCKVVHSKALNYYGLEYFNLIEDYFAFNFAPNKKIFDNVLNFFNKNFTKYLENFKISKNDFENSKNNLKEIIKNAENEIKIGIKDFNKALKAVNFYLEHGLDENSDVYNEKKGGFKIDSKTTRNRLYNFFNMYFKWVPTLVAFSNFEEYLNYKKLKSEFILKYGHLKKLKQKYVLIDKEFVKDLKKYIIKPLEKAILNKEKFEKEIKNGLDSVSYEDFVKTLKSCNLVTKDIYEKDQKKLDETIRKTLGYGI